MNSHSVMFLVGETSGDTQAAALITALRRRQPDWKFFGAGGVRMQAAGMELLLDFTEHAVVGLVDAIKNYRKFRRIFFEFMDEVERRQPSAVVLVDNPGFNLRFARELKKRFPRVKVIYYISPQVWAWHSSRAQQMERDIDLLLTIIPFEKDWFAKHAPRLRVEFVGHPMVDLLAEEKERVQRDPKLVAILPGSRGKEVSHNLPLMTKAIEQMPADYRFVAAAVTDKIAAMMKHPRLEVQRGGAHDLMQRASLAIVASGTATLECAYFGCPMVVIYHVNWVTYVAARLVLRINWIAMPNVIAGKEIVPELLQEAARPDRIARVATDLLQDTVKRSQMERELAVVVASLGQPGASDRAAALIVKELTSVTP
jgi:lipid-A-disaccharide synthase